VLCCVVLCCGAVRCGAVRCGAVCVCVCVCVWGVGGYLLVCRAQEIGYLLVCSGDSSGECVHQYIVLCVCLFVNIVCSLEIRFSKAVCDLYIVLFLYTLVQPVM